MSDVRRFTAIIFREKDGYGSLCAELDVASQGESVEEASANLRQAVELFIDSSGPSEIEGRLRGEVYVTTMEVLTGTTLQTTHSGKRPARFATFAIPSGARIITASNVQRVLDEGGVV